MDRRIKHIMGKYYFKSKFKAPIHIIRNKRLCILLGIKDNTVIETFGGCNPNSEEHKERISLSNYNYHIKDLCNRYIDQSALLSTYTYFFGDENIPEWVMAIDRRESEKC